MSKMYKYYHNFMISSKDYICSGNVKILRDNFPVLLIFLMVKLMDLLTDFLNSSFNIIRYNNIISILYVGKLIICSGSYLPGN